MRGGAAAYLTEWIPKRRSQFRIKPSELKSLYHETEMVDVLR